MAGGKGSSKPPQPKVQEEQSIEKLINVFIVIVQVQWKWKYGPQRAKAMQKEWKMSMIIKSKYDNGDHCKFPTSLKISILAA